jgi:hypothetical protein
MPSSNYPQILAKHFIQKTRRFSMFEKNILENSSAKSCCIRKNDRNICRYEASSRDHFLSMLNLIRHNPIAVACRSFACTAGNQASSNLMQKSFDGMRLQQTRGNRFMGKLAIQAMKSAQSPISSGNGSILQRKGLNINSDTIDFCHWVTKRAHMSKDLGIIISKLIGLLNEYVKIPIDDKDYGSQARSLIEIYKILLTMSKLKYSAFISLLLVDNLKEKTESEFDLVLQQKLPSSPKEDLDRLLDTIFKSEHDITFDEVYNQMVCPEYRLPIDNTLTLENYNKSLANTVSKYRANFDLFFQVSNSKFHGGIVPNPKNANYGFRILDEKNKDCGILREGFLHLINNEFNDISDRVYININPIHAAETFDWIIRNILTKAKYRKATQAKIGLYDDLGTRGDNVVIFTDSIKTSKEIAEIILKNYQVSHMDHFRFDTPRMTERLGKGLSRGAEPKMMENSPSFSQLRAQIISLAFSQAKSCDHPNIIKFKKIVKNLLSNNYINADDPSKNSSFSDFK